MITCSIIGIPNSTIKLPPKTNLNVRGRIGTRNSESEPTPKKNKLTST